MLTKLVLLLFILKVAFSLEKNFTNSDGVISSERKDGRYPNNVHIKYNVRVPNGKIVKLSFQEFNVSGSMPKCEEDSVEVFIGCRGESVGKFCSCGLYEMKLFEFYSKDNCISLVFKTDKEYNGAGFEAHYSSFDKSVSLSPETSCSQLNITQKNVGNFFSPNWPNKYLKNFKCTWTATIPKGYNAIIYFMSLLIEPSLLCAQKSLIDDYVRIEALVGSKNETIAERICSSGVDRVQSFGIYNASEVYVTFFTDADAVIDQKTGFAAGFLSYTSDTSFAECVKHSQVTRPTTRNQVTRPTPKSKSLCLTSTEPWAMLAMMLTVIVLLDIMQLQADANEI